MGRAGNIDHTAITVNHSKVQCTRQVVDTGPALTNLRISLTGETALSRSFGRSEGNRTSWLLVFNVSK